MTPLKKEALEIILANLEKINVSVEAVVGPFVVHARICLGAPTTDAYTVTHRATGIACWTTQTLVDAIHAAEWLDDRAFLPEGDELWAWRAKLLPREREVIIDQLSAIAVRFADGSKI